MKLSNAQMETYLQGLDACHSASGFPGMLIGIAHRRIANELKETDGAYHKDRQNLKKQCRKFLVYLKSLLKLTFLNFPKKSLWKNFRTSL